MLIVEKSRLARDIHVTKKKKKFENKENVVTVWFGRPVYRIRSQTKDDRLPIKTLNVTPDDDATVRAQKELQNQLPNSCQFVL